MSSNKKFLKVFLKKSTIGSRQAQKACVRGLGLRKIGQSVVVEDTPSNRGMINEVSYLLKIEEVS
jgi:large subunit ribosomal protein L30